MFTFIWTLFCWFVLAIISFVFVSQSAWLKNFLQMSNKVLLNTDGFKKKTLYALNISTEKNKSKIKDQ